MPAPAENSPARGTRCFPAANPSTPAGSARHQSECSAESCGSESAREFPAKAETPSCGDRASNPQIARRPAMFCSSPWVCILAAARMFRKLSNLSLDLAKRTESFVDYFLNQAGITVDGNLDEHIGPAAGHAFQAYAASISVSPPHGRRCLNSAFSPCLGLFVAE